MMNDDDRKEAALTKMIQATFRYDDTRDPCEFHSLRWDEGERSVDWQTEDTYNAGELEVFRALLGATSIELSGVEDNSGDLWVTYMGVKTFPWER